jgi:hypothetical protein
MSKSMLPGNTLVLVEVPVDALARLVTIADRLATRACEARKPETIAAHISWIDDHGSGTGLSVWVTATLPNFSASDELRKNTDYFSTLLMKDSSMEARLDVNIRGKRRPCMHTSMTQNKTAKLILPSCKHAIHEQGGMRSCTTR